MLEEIKTKHKKKIIVKKKNCHRIKQIYCIKMQNESFLGEGRVHRSKWNENGL